MFGTSGIRGPVGETVTVELAAGVGRALAVDAECLLIGRDARTSGPFLADALAAGAQAGGAVVYDAGQVATPTLARGVGWQDADAGAMITASHNPPADNGIKLFTATGRAFGPDAQTRIETRLQEETAPTVDWQSYGRRRDRPGLTDRHVDAVVAATETPTPLQIVVDVGTGMGGLTARILRRLGHTVETLNETPDGTFPARPSEPTAETTRTLQSVVATTEADLGIAHDGDADRLRAVDETGRFLDGDTLLAIFALATAAPGDTVVAPVNTSQAVETVLQDNDVDLTYTPVGDVHVAAGLEATETAAFGGEPSGTWIWPEATLAPDGPLAAARLSERVARADGLAALAAAIDTHPLLRESHRVADKTAAVEAIHDTLTDAVGPDQLTTVDGVKATTADGWLLVRASGTEPVVRLTAEAETETRAEELLAWGRDLLGDTS